MAPDALTERFSDPSEEVGTSTFAIFTPGPAFGGDEEDKAAQLARAVENRDLERRPSAPLWGPWVPRGLSALQGVLIGAYQPVIPADDARDFAALCAGATPVGADLRRVWWGWWLWAFEGVVQPKLREEHLEDLAREAGEIYSCAYHDGPSTLEEQAWGRIRRECWIERYSRGIGTLEWHRSNALWATSNAAWADERAARYAAKSAISAGLNALEATERLVYELERAPQWAEVPA